MLTIEELKSKIEALGYIATEELLYDTFNALCLFGDGEIHPGQDIFAMCLEGPPGAGKTEFAKVYTKIASKIFKSKVEMVSYQCDATTGKTELFEDINISAAIRGDADHVNIPGKLIEAINMVNEGKKVVLFIDEYDKAREETDAFLLQFLQDGKINSTQHGDMAIKEEYKGNLQVILCKNDMREEVSGPLSRRIRILRLDYMEPNTFYTVAKQQLSNNTNNPVNSALLNLVTLMYRFAFTSKEIYNRLPSCSEMLIALEDADRLLKRANAPQHIIYNVIIRNMFKSVDDIKTFEKSLSTAKDENDKKLATLVSQMKTREQTNAPVDLNEQMAQTIFDSQSKELNQKISELQSLIDEYKVKFAQLEELRKATIEKEIQKISLEKGKLVSTSITPSTITNFEDETAFIKRGYNIFELSSMDWVDVANVTIPNLSHHFFIDKLMEHASKIGITIYENGILLREDGDFKLIVVNDIDKMGNPRYRIMANQPVLPSTYLNDIANFASFALESYDSQPKTGQQITGEVTGIAKGSVNINSLIYNDNEIVFDVVDTNVYSVCLDKNIEELEEVKKMFWYLTCDDISKPLEVSKKIMESEAKRKVLKDE